MYGASDYGKQRKDKLMYNSSIKGQSHDRKFESHLEIDGKVFFNDMSKNYMCEAFKSCDVIFSEISWTYGYKGFNEKAGNEPLSYQDYMTNINRLVTELGVPAFIVCGKPAARYFPEAKAYPIKINTSETNMSGCQVYVWNFDYEKLGADNTIDLINSLCRQYKKCLDFSCGYGEHLLKFSDFVGCDINRDCLTYLSILSSQRGK